MTKRLGRKKPLAKGFYFPNFLLARWVKESLHPVIDGSFPIEMGSNWFYVAPLSRDFLGMHSQEKYQSILDRKIPRETLPIQKLICLYYKGQMQRPFAVTNQPYDPKHFLLYPQNFMHPTVSYQISLLPPPVLLALYVHLSISETA